MKAINNKNQSKVNRAIKNLILHNQFNDLRTTAEDNEDLKAYKKYNNKAELYFDRYLDLISELPKREVKQIEKSDLY